jgi:NADPH-dependent glutamate synthase beta subunit-like oxidoreductase
MDAARSAWRSGASPVTIVYRRGRDEMPAQVEEIEAAEREGVVVRTGLAPVEVISRDGVVIGLRCSTTRPADAEGDRAAAWEPIPGSENDLAATTILVSVGEEPDPSILPEGAGIEVSGWAGIVADPGTLATGRAGVFAGGDVVSGPKTIIDAVASGRRAAASIHEYLAGVPDGERAILETVRYPTAPEPRLSLDLATRPRAHAPLPMIQPGSFAATQVGFDEATAQREAARCFRCDAVYASSAVEVRAGRGPDVPPASAIQHQTLDMTGGAR